MYEDIIYSKHFSCYHSSLSCSTSTTLVTAQPAHRENTCRAKYLMHSVNLCQNILINKVMSSRLWVYSGITLKKMPRNTKILLTLKWWSADLLSSSTITYQIWTIVWSENVATNSIIGPADPKDGSRSLYVYTSLSKSSPLSQTRIR